MDGAEVCRGCGLEKKLKNSHIIPEWIYKYVYTKNHTFVEISPENFGKLEIEQKGFRQELLCADCELYLSKIEDYGKRLFVDFTSPNPKNISVDRVSSEINIVGNYKYDIYKKFILSILWRMSVSTLRRYDSYQLGPYQEKIRKLIFSSTKITWNEYPIFGRNYVHNNSDRTEIVLLFQPGKYAKKVMYSFVLVGIRYDIIIDESFQDDSLEEAFMNEKTFPIVNESLMVHGLSPSLLKRFTQIDLSHFFEKHS